jgi:hypothetical protein
MVEKRHLVILQSLSGPADVAEPPSRWRWRMRLKGFDRVTIGGDTPAGNRLRIELDTHCLLRGSADVDKASGIFRHKAVKHARKRVRIAGRKEISVGTVRD